MAIDLCSETSPRISFSNDLCPTDITTTTIDLINNITTPRLDSTLLNSNSSHSDFDFEFGVFEQEFSSSADELFSGGILLPIQIPNRIAAPKQSHISKSLPPRPNSSLTSINPTEEIAKENVVLINNNSKTEEQKQQHFKSFWSFKKCTSLDGGGDQGSKKSLISTIPLLLRSNSTGSVPNLKKTTIGPSSSSKQTTQKLAKSASVHTGANLYTYKMQQKVQLKKNYGGRISPVLNVPPPYISKSTANLFGLGSFFSNGKDKKNKR